MKRTAPTLAGLVIVAAILTGCTGSPEPTETTGTPSPTATSIEPTTYAPPADEAEAITAAEETINRLLTVQAEVSAAGGTDPAPYESVATGPALEIYTDDATRINKGPILNEDQESIEGQATVEGAIIFEPLTAYSQPNVQGTLHGLVTVPGCLDISELKITTADGSPAMQNPSLRNKVEYQVIYVEDQETWLVYNRIELGETC